MRRTATIFLSVVTSLASLLTMTGCGDLFSFEPTVSPYSMQLDHHTYYLMVGDSGRLYPLFTPDTISNMTLYWMSDKPFIATFADNYLIGVSPGVTTVTGVSIEYQIYDTCRVYVMAPWAVDTDDGWPFDMVVYADVTVGGQPLAPYQDVAAFCGNEVRGVGERMEQQGVSYVRFRIFSRYNPEPPFDPDVHPQDPLYPYEPEEQPEAFVFRLYDHHTLELTELHDTLRFDGETHGSPSQPYPIRF